MSVLKKTFQYLKYSSPSKITKMCPLGCQRLYSKKSESKESPLKMLLEDAVVHGNSPLRDSPEKIWTSTPYPVKLRESMEAECNFENNEMSIIMFPGQGTHYMGMGQSLAKFPKAQKLFDIASEITNIDLLKIDKPNELFRYSQELIVVCSLAALEKLREERPSALESCVATAGFSLGEITALIFAGAIPFEQGIRLVGVRSAAMEAASKLRPGGMLTVVYTPKANMKKICEKAIIHCAEEGIVDGFCSVANYLYPSCKVLAGSPQALEYIERNKSELGIKLTKRLNVKGAFHSVGVEAAVEPFKRALALCDINTPKLRVLSGVTGMEYKDAKHVRNILSKQIISPVKWEQLLHILYSRPLGMKFPKTFEVGPGKTLRTILKNVNAKAWDSSISCEA